MNQRPLQFQGALGKTLGQLQCDGVFIRSHKSIIKPFAILHLFIGVRVKLFNTFIMGEAQHSVHSVHITFLCYVLHLVPCVFRLLTHDFTFNKGIITDIVKQLVPFENKNSRLWLILNTIIQLHKHPIFS